MTPAKLASIFLALVLAFLALPLQAAAETHEPSVGAYRIFIQDQYGNPYDMEYYVEEAEGQLVQGYKGVTELGVGRGSFPVGNATFEVAGQRQTVYIHPLVMVDVVFTVDVPKPTSEWLKVHYRGQGPDGSQIFGLYADYKMFSPRMWEVKIFLQGELFAYVGVLSMIKENAHVIVLPPGEHTLHLEARHYHLGETFSFDKVVEVEAPAAISYQSTLVSADTMSVAIWLDEAEQLPQGTICKLTLADSGAAFEGTCPVSPEEAIHVALPEGENQIKIEAWHQVEQVTAEFQLTVPIDIFHVSIPMAFAG